MSDSRAVEQGSVWLTRSQISSLIDLAYRGSVNRTVLIRTTSVLRGNTHGRGSIEVRLKDDQREVLIAAASTGKRVHGLVDAVKPLNSALEVSPRRNPRVPKEQSVLVKGGRRCGVCHKIRPDSAFVSRRDQRCQNCRRPLEVLENHISVPTKHKSGKPEQKKKGEQKKAAVKKRKSVKRKRKYDDRNPSVSIRTVSGGLPGLGKRR